jgi:hypothetical protein
MSVAVPVPVQVYACRMAHGIEVDVRHMNLESDAVKRDPHARASWPIP